MKHLGLWRLGAATLAIVASTPAFAGTGHQWGDYRWNTNGATGENVLQLNVSYKFRDKAYWLPYYLESVGQNGLVGALKKWDDGTATYASPLALNDEGETSSTTSMECDPTAGEVVVCADFYGTTEGWVGIAEIDVSNNYILWATARLNDSYYQTAPYMTTYNTDGQKQFVTCHEIGHTFGLGHLDTGFYNPNKGSCMDYTADPDGDGKRSKDNRHPGDVDWQVLNSTTMYGTLSGGGGGGGGKGGGKPGRLDPLEFREVGTPAPQGLANGRFGRIVAYDDQGRPVEYVRDLSNGRKRITFVTWAKGYRPEDSK